MIQSFFDKQWNKINEICKNILDEQTIQISDLEIIRNNISNIYRELDKNLNQIIFMMDSPLSCLIGNCLVNNLLKSKLCGQLYGKLGSQLYGQLYGQLHGQLRDKLYGQLYD